MTAGLEADEELEEKLGLTELDELDEDVVTGDEEDDDALKELDDELDELEPEVLTAELTEELELEELLTGLDVEALDVEEAVEAEYVVRIAELLDELAERLLLVDDEVTGELEEAEYVLEEELEKLAGDDDEDDADVEMAEDTDEETAEDDDELEVDTGEDADEEVE